MLLLEIRFSELANTLWTISFLIWFIAIILLLSGLAIVRSNPESGKKLLSISGIIFLVGLGFCGLGGLA